MSRDELIKEIQNTAVDGKLTCEKAHDMARELHVSLGEIGKLCNELKLKITACELGCF